MKTVILYSLIILSFAFMPDNFKSQQKQFARVKTAYSEKEKLVNELFSAKGIELSSAAIFIRAFKQEAELEIWAKNQKDEKYQLIKTYKICSSSGDLGPKRKQGDGQVPEGFYEINRFNPYSNFYLSLGVSYPNASDKILGNKGNLGGDIFIHGDCVTIGCMPLTDDKIKEVYLMAVEAKSNGGKIPVHIFPFRMNDENMKKFEKKYDDDVKLVAFWKNIRKGYAHFETNKTLPSVSVLNNGEYSIK
jgi:murein L,D-transpeptidase YafK